MSSINDVDDWEKRYRTCSAAVLVAFTASAIDCNVYAANNAIHTVEALVSFHGEVVPILERRCSFCHVSGNTYGALMLDPDLAYDQLVNAPSLQTRLLRVTPGNPAASYLLLKMAGQHATVGGIGTRMPPGWGGLTKEEYDLVYRWIEQGAINN